ncbi:MAG: energy transducer TonB [Xanthomonadales bacterium]|nr:energy transducer TonB [Xanthomonadales bacterium]
MGKFWLRGCAASMLAAALLAACGGSEAPPPDAAAPPADAAATAPPAAPEPAPAPAPVLVEGAGSIEVAEAALREQRLFTPAGDNAFELFVLALERDPASQRVKDALTDLFPYAVLHVEQRTAARDAEDARRVLDLMSRAQPDAPALDRLDRGVEALERRLATEAAQQEAAAARANAPAPTPAPAAPVAPAPVAEQPVAPAPVETPPPAPASPAPEPAPAPTAVAETPAAAPAPAPARLPRVLRQPPLRYPDQAMRQGIEGTVSLDFQINADGSVSDVRVVQANPQGVFEREAMAVVRRTRFEPPPEPTRARRTIEFTLDD